MNAKHEELTAGERRYLEHARRAQGAGLPLSEYCRSSGLSPNSLYSMRRQMREKGILPAASLAKRSSIGAPLSPVAPAGVPSRFVTVRLAEAAKEHPSSPVGMVCRLRHASGWMIECGTWPPASWLQEIVREASDARS